MLWESKLCEGQSTDCAVEEAFWALADKRSGTAAIAQLTIDSPRTHNVCRLRLMEALSFEKRSSCSRFASICLQHHLFAWMVFR